MQTATIATAPLRQWFHRFLDSRTDLTAAHIAAYTTLSRSGSESFLSSRAAEADRFIGDKTIHEFARIRKLIEAGEILQPNALSLSLAILQPPADAVVPARAKKRARGFYITETSRRVAQVLDYCAEKAVIGVVTADYGVGKTTAVQHWRASSAGLATPNCAFEFDEFSRSSLNDFVSRLAETVGVLPDSGARRGSQTMRAIVRQLCDEPQLLILDQCETVTTRVLQLIRQIWDATHHAGTGIVMLSSPLLAERLHSPRLKKEVGSLTSRVGVWAALRGVGRPETAAILRQEGIIDIDDAAVTELLRMTCGSMRRLMAVTDMLAAKHSGKRVTERTVEQVAEHLWGMTVDPRRRAE